MDEPILADIEITRTGPAVPVVGHAFGQILLEPVQASVAATAIASNLPVNPLLPAFEWLHLPRTIVDDPE